MNNTVQYNFVTDLQLLALLDAKEAGKLFPDALRSAGLAGMLPEAEREAKTLWEIHGELSQKAAELRPSRVLLDNILIKMPPESPTVTKPLGEGYTRSQERSYIISIIHYFDSLMQMNWKIAIPIAVVLFLVVGFVGMKDKDENAPMVLEKSGEPSTLAQTTPVAPSIPVVAPTDNVDDLVGSLFSEADSDLTLLSDSDQDISLVSSDSAEITNLTTAYDENTL